MRVLGRQSQPHQPSNRRQKSLRRILGIKPGLNSVTLDRKQRLSQRQLLAGRHPQLPFHQIETCDHLSDRMLDLNPRVHFHEIKAVGGKTARPIDDKLNRPRPLITDRLGTLDGGIPHGLAHSTG